jgi:asparagine synthase (glutamine-hydrolysing)
LDKRAEPLYAALRDKHGFLASIVDEKALEKLIGRHLAQQEDATDRLWRLLNLQLWGDLYLTGRRERWWGGVMSAASTPLEAVPTPL